MRRALFPLFGCSLLMFALTGSGCSGDTTQSGENNASSNCPEGQAENPITGECTIVRDNNSQPPLPNSSTPNNSSSNNTATGGDMGTGDDMSGGNTSTGNNGMPGVIDAPEGCNAGDSLGCNGDNAAFVCNAEGTQYESTECGAGLTCLPGEGCTDKICVPGTQSCDGATGTRDCNADGTGYTETTPCAEGEVCSRGACNTVCELGKYRSSYVGCEYWTLDLDQHTEMIPPSMPADAVPHSVVISNPNDRPATIAFRSWSSSVSVSVPDPTVPPLTSKVFRMPRIDIEGTGITSNSIQISSSIPVTAHQFNPLGNEGVYSNDASLLLPVNTLGVEYYALNVPSRPEVCFMGTCFDPYYAYVTVLATEPGETVLNVTPTARIAAGEPNINSIPPGVAATFRLQRGEVLNLQVGETSLTANQDLSGTHIIATQPVAVFSGHEGSVIGETSDSCCAEHLEQQLFPIKDWGKTYIAAISPGRGIKKDHWRIIAGEDNVTLTTNPPQDGANNVTLNKGEFVKFFSADSFEINATGKIQVGQFLVGQEETSRAVGDPAFILNVPVERFREDYLALIPDGYTNNHLLVVREAGSEITVDGAVVPNDRFTAVGAGTYEYVHIDVSPGVFSLEGDAPFAVYAYGYDSAVSYGYPAGLNLVGNQVSGDPNGE